MHPAERVRQRLGIQILFDFSDITDAIRFTAAHGFRALELNLGNVDFGRQLARARERRRIRSAAYDAGVKLAFHALEGPSFFTPSRRATQCAVDELKQTLDHAADVGAQNVVMHLGFDMHYGLGGRSLYTHEAFPDYFTESLTGALTQLKAHARGTARLCIENVGGFRYAPSHPVMEKLLGGNLGLCLDVGHTNVLAPEKRKAELQFFERHRLHVHHAHVHDNNGARDQHLPIGQGSIDIARFLRWLSDTDALLVFEVRPKEAALECLDYFEKAIAPALNRMRPRARLQGAGTRRAADTG